MSTTQSERLRELLEPLVSSQGLDLEEIEWTRSDASGCCASSSTPTTGADLDAIADVSRALSAKLDETDAMGEGEYTLEVGTPGAERALTEHRHYVRATDRLVKFQLTRRRRAGRPDPDGGRRGARCRGAGREGRASPPPAARLRATSPRRASRSSSTARTRTTRTEEEEA